VVPKNECGEAHHGLATITSLLTRNQEQRNAAHRREEVCCDWPARFRDQWPRPGAGRTETYWVENDGHEPTTRGPRKKLQNTWTSGVAEGWTAIRSAANRTGFKL